MERPGSLGHTATLRSLESEAAEGAVCGVRILLTGEHGVGKRTLARLIHEHTRGAGAPLVVLDCAEISDSTFECEWLDAMITAGGGGGSHDGWLRTAQRGTIHLRSLEQMTPRQQAALYRHLDARHGAIGPTAHQARSIDVRLITSADTSLLDAVQSGAFRQDLFYRVNTVHLRVPPLRERLEEVGGLFDHFVQEVCDARQCAVPAIAPETLQALTAYSWPGNVRELKETAIRLVTKGGDSRTEDPARSRQVQFETLPVKRPGTPLQPDGSLLGSPRPRTSVQPRSAH